MLSNIFHDKIPFLGIFYDLFCKLLCFDCMMMVLCSVPNVMKSSIDQHVTK